MRKILIAAIALLASATFIAPASAAVINCNTNSSTWCNGTSSGDTMTSDSRNQLINSKAGPDHVEGNHGNDLIVGNKGIDSLYGNEHGDEIAGGLSQDFIYGGYGNDWLNAGCRRAETPYRSYCSEFQTGEAEGWYHGGPDRDIVISINGKYDAGTCGPGNDLAYVDLQDVLATNSFLDCEEVVCVTCNTSGRGTTAFADRGVLNYREVSESQADVEIAAARAQWESENGTAGRPTGGDDD